MISYPIPSVHLYAPPHYHPPVHPSTRLNHDCTYVYDDEPANSRTSPPASDINPLRQAATLLALHIDDIRVAAAAATNTVLLGVVVRLPVLVLLEALALVERRLLEPGLTRQLARRRVGRAVLDGGVAVAKVAEVMDVAWSEQRAGCEGVDRGVSPLLYRATLVLTGT
jgi:hypothetical protein